MSDADTKVPSYRDTDTSIQPLPAFVTVQVERPADEQAAHPRRTIDDWQRDMTANLNRMATDEQYRREVAARQS
ncbi:MAG: hypothetical protein ACRC1O_05540 [Ralstonia mannitolilytica]